MGTVAVIDDRIFFVFDTFPFAFPLSVPSAAFFGVYPRMIGEISQNNRIDGYLVFANEDRVIVLQVRTDIEGKRIFRHLAARR